MFRPSGSAHRVVDVGAGVELGGRYRQPDGRVSLLTGATFDAGHTRRLLCLEDDPTSPDLPGSTADRQLAGRLARIAPSVLWPAADDLRRRTDELGVLMADLPVRDAGLIASLDELATLHEDGERFRRSHRPVQVSGAILAGACALAGGALWTLPSLAGEDTFTPTALLTLSVGAALVAAGDAVVTGRHARRGRRVMAAAGLADARELAARLGPLADPERRRSFLEAVEAQQEAAAQWYALTAGAPLDWALRNRDRIILLAARHHTLGYVDGVVAGRRDPESALGAVAERIGELRHAGPTAGALPLILDEPFGGFDPATQRRLLNGVLRLAGTHQILLVSGNPVVEAWACDPSIEPSIGLARLSPTAPASAPVPAVAPATAPAVRVPEPVPVG